MKRINRKKLCVSLLLMTVFILWTLAVNFVDVKAIGPRQSSVGFSELNGFVHNITGVNINLYNITDWLGLVPIAVALSFALFGLIQWIRRKKLLKVDYSILALGVFYIVVMSVYILFENIVINYRPVLISGCLEASYPSSTTLIVLTVMPTALIELNNRIKNKTLKNCVALAICGFICFMVIGRLLSGVHWFTDIIGGLLLSAALVKLYSAVTDFK